MLITADEARSFPGGWCLDGEAVQAALAALPAESISVLEFGAGHSTDVLCDLLLKYNVLSRYVSYENNRKFVTAREAVETVLWETFPSQLIPGRFNLVIVDGPNGPDRQKWYPLLRDHVDVGSILLIDDFHHYREFGEALDANFMYTELASCFVPMTGRANVSWKVVRVEGFR